MQTMKTLTARSMPLMLAVVMVVSMCLVVAPAPQVAQAGEALPELVAPGHTTHLNTGQTYIVTAELENFTGQTLYNLYARIYAKQAESPDIDSPPTGMRANELCWDPFPVAPGTQDAGQDWNTDNDTLFGIPWIENGSPSGAPFLPGWWLTDRGLHTAGPDDGINAGTSWSDDEGSGDNAWPWIDTGDLGTDRWMDIKPWIDGGQLVPDCPDPVLGTPSAANNYANSFSSFNHIRLIGDEPHIKQLDPLLPGFEQTVGWLIQCIGDGDVDIRVYFWEEGEQGEQHPVTLAPYTVGLNCAGLMWAGNEEMDSPCHSGLADPADRDDWRNVTGLGGLAANNVPANFDGNQINEDWIWFTESQLICQGPIQVPDIQIDLIPPETCIPVGTDFTLRAIVTNDTPCSGADCDDPGWARDVVARIDPNSIWPKIGALSGGTIAYVGDLAPGASTEVEFHLTCLQEGQQPAVRAVVTAKPETCSPASCWGCYIDDDVEPIWQCGNPELEVEIVSPKDFMWDPGSPMYEGAAIHTGGEFAIRARVWNIGAAEAENVWATLRDIPLDPKTEKPYFEVVQTVKDPPQEIALSAGLSPLLYQDIGMEDWIPGSSATWITGNDTYNDNYSPYGWQKYLGMINMNEYKTVEFTLKPTETWMEAEQSCNEVKLTGFTVMARRTNGYPQSSGAMIDDGRENENVLSGHDRKSSIAKWISDWSTSTVDCADGIQCNEAACGNSFVSLQGTPMYYYDEGTPMIDPGWFHAGTHARVIVPEPISFDLLDDIAIHVNSGPEDTYGGYLGLEVGLGPFCCRPGSAPAIPRVNLPIIQINIENLSQDVNVNGVVLDTNDTGIHITYQPGTPGWRKNWNAGVNPHSFAVGGTGWDARAEWMTDADCSTWEKFGTHADADILADGPHDDLWVPGLDSQMAWVIDWDQYGTPATLDGNLSPYIHYTWDEIQAMFDRGVGTPAIATVKSIEIRCNSSGTPVFVDDIRITDDFHGDIKKGDGPSEYTNDCDQDNYLNCACPGIIEAPQVLVYPAADLNVVIDGPEGIEVVEGGTIMFSGVVENHGNVDAWDVDIVLDIVEQPGFGLIDSIAVPEGFTKHLNTVKGGQWMMDNEGEYSFQPGTVGFSWKLKAYVPGLYRFEVMPSGIDECGWHVKQNADEPAYERMGRPSGGNLLLVDDSADYPIPWVYGDQMTAYVGVEMPDPVPSIEAEISYPDNGDMFFEGTTFAVTAVVVNDGEEALTGVAANLNIISDITGTMVIDTPVVDTTMDPGDMQMLAWTVQAGTLAEADCVMQLMVTGMGSVPVVDMVPLTVRIDPKVTLTIYSGPNGSIGCTSDVCGEGNYMFPKGTEVSIKATPDTGVGFVAWVGDIGTVLDPTDATTKITMNDNYEIGAAFGGGCLDVYGLLDCLGEYLDGNITVMELLDCLASYLSCS